jgi:hypothetical protein
MTDSGAIPAELTHSGAIPADSGAIPADSGGFRRNYWIPDGICGALKSTAKITGPVTLKVEAECNQTPLRLRFGINPGNWRASRLLENQAADSPPDGLANSLADS